MNNDIVTKKNLLVYRTAVSAMFLTLGIDFASWASRIPDIKGNLFMDDAVLGAVLLASPIGSLLTLPLAGWLVTNYGSRKMILLSAIGYSVVLPFLGFSQNVWQLSLALFMFGIGGEILNISVNTQAVEVEKLYPKPIMSSFHGFFSIGGFIGAALGGLMIQINLSPANHFLIMMAFGVSVTLVFYRNLLANDSPSEHDSHPLFARPTGSLVGLGIIAFCCMLGEGAMADWSSEYFKRTFHTESGLNTAAYTAFSLAMALGRFNGDWLTLRLGATRILKVSGWLSGLGLLAALLIPYQLVVIVGFACVGFGFATVVPLVYSAAGRSKTMAPGVALAAVSTLGYLGFLFGPPMIGFISKVSSLQFALGVVVFLSLMIVLLSVHAKEDE